METTNGPLNRKLRMALVGGGQGAFIGRVHATAAVIDNRAELVAGALSSNPEKARSVFCAPNIGIGGYLGSAYAPIFVGSAKNHPAMDNFEPPPSVRVTLRNSRCSSWRIPANRAVVLHSRRRWADAMERNTGQR